MVHFIILTAFAVVISIIDIASLKIPDLLLAALFLVSFSIDLINQSYMRLLMSLASSAAVFLLFFLIFKLRGGMGFGDVKYAGVIGYVLGFQKALFACLAASLLGIAFFLVLHFVPIHKKHIPFKREMKIPFGPFLSFGLILCSIEKLL